MYILIPAKTVNVNTLPVLHRYFLTAFETSFSAQATAAQARRVVFTKEAVR
ncbi:hypothetical protein QO002_003278 [Pararhizobium capsulatum DSM 1112]|uniref:Uncharacterized protein n=1 Tax=Pararhizobium capsulatum DSM 1112 TaxID=1121113 RepID=A0ABU0BUK4_9HYPH|nr:hypothetical protein [Pararhizobium capsulatum DSM 1112]